MPIPPYLCKGLYVVCMKDNCQCVQGMILFSPVNLCQLNISLLANSNLIRVISVALFKFHSNTPRERVASSEC